jgi:hypothetical protein
LELWAEIGQSNRRNASGKRHDRNAKMGVIWKEKRESNEKQREMENLRDGDFETFTRLVR